MSTNDPQSMYVNKELSWLEFNSRVLEEALTPEVPLAERLKFLSIFTSNLDEFFMVRVAGLKKIQEEGLRLSDSPDSMNTAQTLSAIRQRTAELIGQQYKCLHEQVLPQLAQRGLRLVSMEELTAEQKSALDQYFQADVMPVLTPLGFDPAHPFPFLSNQSIYMIVTPKDAPFTGDAELPPIGFVEVPAVLPRLVPVPDTAQGTHQYVLLEDLIANNLSSLFFGFDVESAFTIRVTRNLDYNLLENKVVDLLKSIQREMVNREHQEVVRVEVDERMPESYIELLKARLNVSDADIYRVAKPLFIPGIMSLYGAAPDDIKDQAFNPRLPPALASSEDIFSVIAKSDLLVHHPYESFYAVTEFLTSAATDPNVLAIKITLYRSAGDSPIIDALIAAAENGKQVTAVVELKARFDEKNNISWARRLERAGVNVVFGFVGLKTHCKMTLVVRREKSKLVRYVHVSTGNYNSNTAKLYTDIGLFTTSDAVGQDVATIFNLITGFDVLSGANRVQDQLIKSRLQRLSLSPINTRSTIIKNIEHEAEIARRTGSGFIRAKMNALVDKDIIDALYRASQAGVKIQLIVRGTCCIRPGIPGLSDNIEVISIIDRFLEHSRVLHFQASGEHNVYIGSADWMPRNMDRRIEILVPIENANVKNRLINEILAVAWADNVKARVMGADGRYTLRKPTPHQPAVRSQQRFIEIARAGGIQSMPYEIAIRHTAKTPGKRPIAKKKQKKHDGHAGVQPVSMVPPEQGAVTTPPRASESTSGEPPRQDSRPVAGTNLTASGAPVKATGDS